MGLMEVIYDMCLFEYTSMVISIYIFYVIYVHTFTSNANLLMHE